MTNNINKSHARAETPLPMWQVISVFMVQLCEAMNVNVLFPFLAFMIEDMGHGGHELGYYAGGLAAAFCGAQFSSSVAWGMVSDTYGRKPAVFLGTLGTAIGMLVFGTAKSYWQAVLGRIIGGVLCGNLGVVKSFLSEITDETNQGKGFSYLSIAWSLGSLLAPLAGGLLCSPADKYPQYFSKDGIFGYYPYFLPCLICIIGNVCTAFFCLAVMGETRKFKKSSSTNQLSSMSSKVKNPLQDIKEIEMSRSGLQQQPMSTATKMTFHGDDDDQALLTRRGLSRTPEEAAKFSILSQDDDDDDDEEEGDVDDDDRNKGRKEHVSEGEPVPHLEVVSSGSVPNSSSPSHHHRPHENIRSMFLASDINYSEMTMGEEDSSSDSESDNGSGNKSTAETKHESTITTLATTTTTTTTTRPTTPQRPAEKKKTSNNNSNGDDENDHHVHDDDDDDDIDFDEDELCCYPSPGSGGSAPHPSSFFSNCCYFFRASGRSQHPHRHHAHAQLPTSDTDIDADIEYGSSSSHGLTTPPPKSATKPGNSTDKKHSRLLQQGQNPRTLVLRQRTVLLATGNYGILAMAYILFDETIPLFLKLSKAYGGLEFTSSQIGFLLSISGGAMLGFNYYLLPYFITRVSKKSMFEWGIIGSIPFALLWPVIAVINAQVLIPRIHDQMSYWSILWPLLIVICILKNVFACLSFTAVMLQINHSVIDEYLGAVNGLGQSLASLARAFGPALGGMLWSISIQSKFVFLNFLSVVSILVVSAMINRLLPDSINHKKKKKKKHNRENNEDEDGDSSGGAGGMMMH